MTPQDYLDAARVPKTLKPQTFGLWTIERRLASESVLGERGLIGWPDFTLLRRITIKSLHLECGEVVMEDSRRELSRHLPIWLAARGRVLKTGLGLGCVVRGLLANPDVEHIDVVEIDKGIIRVCGAEFVGNPRVTVHHADALTWDRGGRMWDFAWHDLHSFDEEHLDLMHAKLLIDYREAVGQQGAWQWPRLAHRVGRQGFLGDQRRRTR